MAIVYGLQQIWGGAWPAVRVRAVRVRLLLPHRPTEMLGDVLRDIGRQRCSLSFVQHGEDSLLLWLGKSQFPQRFKKSRVVAERLEYGPVKFRRLSMKSHPVLRRGSGHAADCGEAYMELRHVLFPSGYRRVDIAPAVRA